MHMREDERRREVRVDLTRPCKVYDPRGERYHAGRTSNVSRCAVLLELARGVRLKPGSRVFVAIALKRRQGILARQEMIEAEVIRAMEQTGGRVTLALRLATPLSIAAPRAIAA